MKKSHKIVNIFNINIDSTSFDKVLKKVAFRIKNFNGKPYFITTINPEILNLSLKDKKLKEAIDESNLRVADGAGLKLASLLKGAGNIEILPGSLLMEKLIEKANENKWKVFLLGASKESNSLAILKLKEKYKDLVIKGDSGPFITRDAKPVTQRDAVIYKDTLRYIQKNSPDLLFVGFGAPKQEKFIFENINNFGKTKVVMCVGGSIDYISGVMKKPPLIINRIGLEWLWRLIIDPKRYRRIFNATFVFLWNLVRFY